MLTPRTQRPLMTLGLLSLLAGCSAQSGAADAAVEPAALPPKLGLCASCHNVDGMASVPGYPHLAGQSAEYMRLAIAKYRSGERPHAAMRASVNALTESDLDLIIHYYAALPRASLPRDAAPSTLTPSPP